MSENDELTLLICCSSSCMLVLCILIAGIFFVYMSSKWTSKKKKELSDRLVKDNLLAKWASLSPKDRQSYKFTKLMAFLCHVEKNNIRDIDSAEKDFDFLRSDFLVAFAEEVIEAISRKYSYTYTKKNLDKGMDKFEKAESYFEKFGVKNMFTKAGCETLRPHQP